MTDTVITGPWKPRAVEPRPNFGMKKLGEMAAACGDAFDLGVSRKSADASLQLAFAAKLEQHAQNARLLAEEARMLNLAHPRWTLITEAEKLERRAVEIEANYLHEE